MARCLIAFGSNLGDRQANLSAAIAKLADVPDVCVIATSRFAAFRPAGGPVGQAEFLNAVVLMETSFGPQQLLDVLFAIENQMGRERHIRWGQRTIDIDLLTLDDLVQESPTLTLPHPRMSFRRFVLEPACEIAGDFVHPLIKQPLGKLLDHLNSTRDFIAIAGVDATRKIEIAKAVSEETGAKFIKGPDDPSPLDADFELTGRSCTTAIELVQKYLCLGDQIPENSWSIGHFWLDEIVVLAFQRLVQQEREAFAAYWEKNRHVATPPKLLVLLDESRELDDVWRNRSTALRKYIFENHHAPLLRLGCDNAEAIAEVTAAIQAMA